MATNLYARIAAGDPSRRIPRVAARGVARLSFAQARFFVLDQLISANRLHVMVDAITLSGALDVGALRSSLDALVERHSALRTRFQMTNAGPVQEVVRASPLDLPVVDLSDVSATERTARLEQLMDQLGGAGFDLAAGALLRAGLVRFAPTEHVLAVAIHHIAADGWSLNVLVRDLSELYTSAIEKRPARLPELTIEYVDYAEWQRDSAHTVTRQNQLDYWRAKLGAEPPRLELPADRPRPAAPTYRGGVEYFQLEAPSTDRLDAFCKAHRVTPFMVLLGAFAVVLSRYSAQPDLIIGTPVAHRELPETENLVGLFLNTLPLRISLDGNPTFVDLVTRVRNTAVGAYANQDVPFEHIVEALDVPIRGDGTSLFTVAFNFESTPDPAQPQGPLRLAPLRLHNPPARFPLTLYAARHEGTIKFELVYQADVFEPETMRVLGRHLRTLVAGALSDPASTIDMYSLHSDETRAILPDFLEQWDVHRPRGVPERFWDVVRRHADTAAVEDEGGTTTYRVLGRLVEQAKHRLTESGVGALTTVAVTGARCAALYATMLAVVDLGALLVTIDPTLPAGRQQWMAAEAGAQYKVTVAGPTPKLGGWNQRAVVEPIDLPSGRADLVRDSIRRRANERSADPAYVFFTSGTTAHPQAVIGTHEGMAHFIEWQTAEFGIGPGDRFPQLTGLSFNVLLRDVFTPLSSGATLCAPTGAPVASATLLAWLQQSRVTRMHTVPALASGWLDRRPPGVTLPTLRSVFFAGEPLSGRLVARWRAAFPSCDQVVNLYGQTEASMAKFWYLVPPAANIGTQPVGVAIPRTAALVVRDRSQLCDINEVGEVLVRTPHLSLGYLNDEMQHERFFASPASGLPTDLVFATGDQGRYRADGLLEVLGRVDQQIKVRGLRINPDEIAAAVGDHPAVAQCVVLAIARPNAIDLAAYFVAVPSGDIDRLSLRSHVASILPAAMVPAHWFQLDEIPVTNNGKVDSAALRALFTQAPAQSGRPPRDGVECEVARLWMEHLALPDQPAATDDFFALGGQSLTAMEMVASVRERFGVALPLVAVFANPTLEMISAAIQARVEEGEDHGR